FSAPYSTTKHSWRSPWVEELQYFVSKSSWIIQVDHMGGLVNLHEMFISDDRQPLLFVGALGVTALFAIDEEDRTFDAAKKLHGLRRVKGLGRDRAVQRIKFPDPFAHSILLHP